MSVLVQVDDIKIEWDKEKPNKIDLHAERGNYYGKVDLVQNWNILESSFVIMLTEKFLHLRI